MGAALPVVGRAPAAKWLAVFLLALANLLLIFLVAGGFSTVADAIAPLTGHLIGIELAASVALLVRRRMLVLVTGGLALTVALHAWLGLARCCAAPPSALRSPITRVATQSAAQGLTVLALNTWDRQSDLDRLERYLAAAPADVVVLSEFGPPKRALLARLKGVYPFQVECAGEWDCSLALISRIPFEASGTARMGADKPAFVWARAAGVATIIGTHLYRPSRDPWLHQRQMTALAQLIRNIDGPVVLAGDLNTSPWSSSFRTLRAATGLVPAGILTPTWPAWPVPLPQVALDHIFVSTELAVTVSGTGPAVGSDHLPIWARLERRTPMHERSRHFVRRLASGLAAPCPHLGGQLLADLAGEHGGARNLCR